MFDLEEGGGLKEGAAESLLAARTAIGRIEAEKMMEECGVV